jgi:hypothetical protein
MALSRILGCSGLMAAAVALASPAHAVITIQAGGASVQPAENVLSDTSMTAQTVMGSTNQTGRSVSFTSLNNELLRSTSSNGQARFETTDGTLDTARFFLTNGGSFTQAEFNLFSAQGSTSSVLISVNGGAAQSFTLGNGENFFNVFATGSDVITSITFDTNGVGVTDLRQVRLGGFSTTAAVPEPATWAMMFLGFGGVGFAMRRRSKVGTRIRFA